MKSLLIILSFPLLLCAQGFEFELDPDAFPVEINGWRPFAPWAGGIDNSKPELCDLDNDGDLDYFIGEYCGYVKYYQNVGTIAQPNFIFITDFLDSLQCPTPGYPSDVEFVDLNGDGLLDALVGGKQGVWDRVLLYYNSGTPSIPDFEDIADTLRDDSGNDVYGRRKATVDIDCDGDYDIFAGMYNGTIRYYLNIGTSISYLYHLESTTWSNIDIPDGDTDPTFADLDADGDLDLLVGTGDGTIYYYRNDGTPQVPQMTFVTNNYFGIDVGESASPELADIDGDGDLDLFVGRHDDYPSNVPGDIYFYENTGSLQTPNFQLVTKNYLVLAHEGKPRLIDIDADGDPDLFSTNETGLVFYRNEGDLQNPHFVYVTDQFANITMPWGLEFWFCDIDADGDYDLFISTGAIPGPPGLYLYLNQGTPQRPNYVLYSSNLLPGVFTQSSVILFPCTADIDVDGDQDLFVRDNPGYCYFFRNVGSPTNFQFQFVTNNWQNLHDSITAQYMCFYDIDGDGDLDLFGNHDWSYQQPWDKNLRFYRNIGTPQNANMQLEIEDVFPGLMIWSSCPFLIDMDQDGDGDLFVGDAWGGIRYFKNVTGDTTAVLHPDKVPIPPPSRTVLSIGNNPSNPITAISYQLSAVSLVNLSVYDISGRRVAQLVNTRQNPGDYSVSWNATGNASGVYLVRLVTPEEEIAQKVVILK